jgi:hypothetical protein
MIKKLKAFVPAGTGTAVCSAREWTSDFSQRVRVLLPLFTGQKTYFDYAQHDEWDCHPWAKWKCKTHAAFSASLSRTAEHCKLKGGLIYYGKT